MNMLSSLGVHVGFSLDLGCECLEYFSKHLRHNRRIGQWYDKAMAKSRTLGKHPASSRGSRQTTIIVLQLFHCSSQARGKG